MATKLQEAPVESAVQPVHLRERCDRCGARAYVGVAIKVGGTLAFCKNHFEYHESTLRKVATVTDDTRSVLYDDEH